MPERVSSSRKIWLLAQKNDLATDCVVLELRRRGIPHIRINFDDFPSRTAITWTPKGPHRVEIQGAWTSIQGTVSVWCRRLLYTSPKVHGQGPQASELMEEDSRRFITGFWETTTAFWVNRPDSTARAENKLVQLAVAVKLGLSIPQTLVTNDRGEAADFLSRFRQVVCKPIGSSRMVSGLNEIQVYTTRVSPKYLTRHKVLEPVPLILQEELQKQREIRVTVVGSRVFASSIRMAHNSDFPVDIHLAEDPTLRFEPIRLPKGLQMAIKRLMTHFGLVYGCLDFIVTPKNEWFFLELNPSGQWGWIERGTGLKITEAIVDVLSNSHPFTC